MSAHVHLYHYGEWSNGRYVYYCDCGAWIAENARGVKSRGRVPPEYVPTAEQRQAA
jgi:hypothetical protein